MQKGHGAMRSRFALILIFLACGLSAHSAAQAAPSLNLMKKAVITTDAEGGSARPEIAATADRVFVVYLGNIRQRSNRTFDVKIYDRNLDTLIASKTLVATTADYGGPTDIRVVSDGQHFYAIYETVGLETHLWAAKYALTDGFERVAQTPTPLVTSALPANLAEGGEVLNDPALMIGPRNVFVATRLKYSILTQGKTVYRVRELDKNTLTVLATFDLDLSDAADGVGRVASLLYQGSNIYMVLPTTASDEGSVPYATEAARSDLVLVRMNEDWTFDPHADVYTASAEPDDRESYVSGLESDGRYFFLTYVQQVGALGAGEGRAIIKILDSGNGFLPVYTHTVQSLPWESMDPGGVPRPSLELQGDRLLSGQQGDGNAEVYVYEIKDLFLRVNGLLSEEVTVSNPVTVDYTIRGGQGREFFYALDAPALGVFWSYLNAAGQWVPMPDDVGAVTPFWTAPADGDYLFFSGTVPAGTYTLCLGYDQTSNGRLDMATAVYDCVEATVQ